MSSLIDFYTTQARVLWEWRGGPWALIKRLVITLLVSTISLVLTAWIMPGVNIARFARRSDRRDADGRRQRHHPAGAPGGGGPSIPHPDGGPRHRLPGHHLPRRRAVGAGRGSRRLHYGLHRIVHLRGLQHRADRDPRRRPWRVVLRAARVEPARKARGGAERQARASSSSRSTGWPTRSSRPASAPER